MLLSDDLARTLLYFERLWRESNIRALDAAVIQLGYNDAGLICAQLRARAQTSLAIHIEKLRFK